MAETIEPLGEPVAFLGSTYDEALRLTREARDYVAYQEAKDRSDLSAPARLVASCETMRLTTRLTQVMAWLMVQQAVHAGEISRADAAQPRFRLSGQKVCAAQERFADAAVPPRLAELLEHSLSLYQRVARLDAMMVHSESASSS